MRKSSSKSNIYFLVFLIETNCNGSDCAMIQLASSSVWVWMKIPVAMFETIKMRCILYGWPIVSRYKKTMMKRGKCNFNRKKEEKSREKKKATSLSTEAVAITCSLVMMLYTFLSFFFFGRFVYQGELLVALEEKGRYRLNVEREGKREVKWWWWWSACRASRSSRRVNNK